MAKFQKLHAHKGTDEANHDGVLYRVDNDGNIEVPNEAVDALLKTGGFVAEDLSDDDPEGFARVKSFTGATRLSWGGNSYSSRADGSFLVPAVAVSDLLSHGFFGDETPEPEPVEEAEKKTAVPKLTIPAK